MAKVYFYYAAMNAGKSTVLLQSSYNYRERGMRTLLFRALHRHRYGPGRIESRIGLSSSAIRSPHRNLFSRVRAEHAAQPVACVLIDEAQFLSVLQAWQVTTSPTNSTSRSCATACAPTFGASSPRQRRAAGARRRPHGAQDDLSLRPQGDDELRIDHEAAR